ncbi:D-glucuronyl C5-epimerase family protein [Aminobacterium mobile]|uniref:D-glucuronyl C5-epimerase family protein n=1 Tax=Aminobacterium mobile TaxID=81467 RepID=UPI0004653353|nr:D-glucuronyl C5-epimerase family protein [Aminobacterium mobile]
MLKKTINNINFPTFTFKLISLIMITIISLFCAGRSESANLAPFKYGITSSATEYANSGRRSLDKNRILVFDYGKAYNSLGKWHNPFFIARYAHALYNDWYKTNCTDDNLKNDFLLQAKFLLSSYKEERKGMAYWIYPFENTYFGAKPGWISGIGQSLIAGVLLRAYEITGNQDFENVAKKAIEVYFHPMSSGGVVTSGEMGLWIQEVASPDCKEFCILNGHITGLLGLIDIANLTSDKKVYDVVTRGIATVRNHLHDFDAGFSSFYSLKVKDGDQPIIAPRNGYNALHVWQLEKLFEITKKPEFLHAAILFKKYEEVKDIRNAKGSTNPNTHGPDEAAGWFGNRYWSHNKFPTYYEVHMASEEALEGVFIGAHFQKAAPLSLSVSLFQNDKWVKIWSTEKNIQKDIFLSFSNPILASAIRIDIYSDNGNKNVALNTVMPIRSLKSVSANYDQPVVTLSTLVPGFRKND